MSVITACRSDVLITCTCHVIEYSSEQQECLQASVMLQILYISFLTVLVIVTLVTTVQSVYFTIQNTWNFGTSILCCGFFYHKCHQLMSDNEVTCTLHTVASSHVVCVSIKSAHFSVVTPHRDCRLMSTLRHCKTGHRFSPSHLLRTFQSLVRRWSRSKCLEN